MNFSKEQLRNVISQAIDKGKNGKLKACKQDLQTIYQSIQADPFLLWDDKHISLLGKAIIMMIHFDLIDDEEQNIGLAHLSYLCISRGIEREENSGEDADTSEIFRMRKDRIILLKNFDDFFVDSLQEFYFANHIASNRESYNEQRKTVLARMPYLQFADIHSIEHDYQNLRNDEYLLELANFIEYDHELTGEALKEAYLLHKILFKYTYQKLKNGKLLY